MTITLTPDGRVRLAASIDLPMSRRRLWAEIADLPRFAAHDFFHARFDLPEGRLEAGAPLSIRHRYLGITIGRVGRVLRYREGDGYSFSDLSRRSRTKGFPHVFTYRIESVDDQRSRLHLEVRGRWTLPFIPHWLARVWLAVVFFQIVLAVDNELLWCCPRPRPLSPGLRRAQSNRGLAGSAAPGAARPRRLSRGGERTQVVPGHSSD